MYQKNPKLGFTLIEMIVVITIISVLATIAIPSLIGYITEAQVSVCEVNLATSNRFLNYKQVNLARLSKPEADDLYTTVLKETNARCPGGGEYKLAQIGIDIFVPICSISTHGEGYIGETFYFTIDIIAKIKADPGKYGLRQADINTNDKITEAINKHFDFGKLKANGKVLQIEPYYEATSSNILIFAKNSYLGRDWCANYLYSPKDGKWYTAPKTGGYITVANRPAADVYAEMHLKGWTALSGASEVRASEKKQ